MVDDVYLLIAEQLGELRLRVVEDEVHPAIRDFGASLDRRADVERENLLDEGICFELRQQQSAQISGRPRYRDPQTTA